MAIEIDFGLIDWHFCNGYRYYSDASFLDDDLREALELVEAGYLRLDPTGQVFSLTLDGWAWCREECARNRDQGHAFSIVNPRFMEKADYARAIGKSRAEIEVACLWTLAPAVNRLGYIDATMAASLWKAPSISDEDLTDRYPRQPAEPWVNVNDVRAPFENSGLQIEFSAPDRWGDDDAEYHQNDRDRYEQWAVIFGQRGPIAEVRMREADGWLWLPRDVAARILAEHAEPVGSWESPWTPREI